MSDLIERLDEYANSAGVPPEGAYDLVAEAKAEIERLQSDNKWLGELRDQLCSDKALLTALRKEDGEDMQRLSDQLDYLSDENAKLQIVVDAAEDYLSDPHNDSEQALFKAIAAWRFKAIAARRGEK